jgi:DNA-binding CsgD family transcriptional regulator
VFEAILAKLRGQATLVTQRPEGVAFLSVAKNLYGFLDIEYLCINIPTKRQDRYYSHCLYSDRSVSQFLSPKAIDVEPELQRRINGHEIRLGISSNEHQEGAILVPCRQRVGEIGYIGVTLGSEVTDVLCRELRTLGGYFHSHVLRINGHDDNHILLSARELDCLKWTAAGKTAWEASVILGITERTVRFHLNAARTKLNCANTTQAVAEAIAHNLIEL